MESFLAAIGAHPHAALLAVFGVAFAESLAVVGAIVPAAIVMFAAGTLIGAGALDLWITLAAAVSGAALGDGLSYELGRSHEARIRSWPLFQRFAGAFERGEKFLQAHGGKSILLARFAAPVRAFVPLLAGFGQMPRRRFYAINIASALLWAPVHILPGVLFGASLHVAEAVSGRLALIVLLLVALIWGVLWLMTAALRFVVPWVQRGRDAAVRWARGRSALTARATLALLDPERPDSHSLLFGAVLLVAAGWLFLGVLEDVLAKDTLVQVDLAVFQFLQQLRTDSVDRAMVFITGMGSVGVLLPLAITVTLWLVWRRSWRTAGYWIAAPAFGEVLVQVLKFTLGRRRPLDLYTGVEQFSFPSGHAVVSTVMLGFLAFLLSRGQSMRVRLALAAIAGLYVALVAFSRLYLGAHWLSDVAGGTSLGVAWISMLAMVYTHRGVQEDFRPRQLTLLVAMSLVLYGAVWNSVHSVADLKRYAMVDRSRPMTAQQWLGQGWRSLPERRIDTVGHPEEPFAIQWACSGAEIAVLLEAAGWHAAAPWSLPDTLGWLVPHTALADHPVLPRFDRGKSPGLVFLRTGAHDQEREVLRLWRSDIRLSPAAAGFAPSPVWYGALYRERHVHHGWLASPTIARETLPVSILALQLPPDRLLTDERERQPGGGKTLLALCR
jgi:membrane protein DedA with SNARE-associated domain/membrane-associated phospholipid phosphatase